LLLKHNISATSYFREVAKVAK